MIEWVDKELDAWGLTMKGEGSQLGFKRETLEYKMMKYGPDSLVKDTKGSGMHESFVSEGVAKTESILLAMPFDLKTLAVVVYTMPGFNRDSQARVLSKRLGLNISRRKLIEMLGNLHHRYEAYNSAINSYAKKDFNYLRNKC